MSDATADPAAARCAVHPGRPAVDACPRCGRPRCAADSAAARGDCAGCRADPGARAVGAGERLVRAGLAAAPAAYVGGWIVTQYVDDHVFSWLAPGLLGMATAWVTTGVRRPIPTGKWLATAVAALAAVLGTALGFRLVPGGRQSVVSPAHVVVAPYLAAAAGALLWLLVATPPSRGGPTTPGR